MSKPKFNHANYSREIKRKAALMVECADRLQKALDAMTRARVCQSA
jgi:hypothetical protein